MVDVGVAKNMAWWNLWTNEMYKYIGVEKDGTYISCHFHYSRQNWMYNGQLLFIYFEC